MSLVINQFNFWSIPANGYIHLLEPVVFKKGTRYRLKTLQVSSDYFQSFNPITIKCNLCVDEDFIFSTGLALVPMQTYNFSSWKTLYRDQFIDVVTITFHDQLDEKINIEDDNILIEIEIIPVSLKE